MDGVLFLHHECLLDNTRDAYTRTQRSKTLPSVARDLYRSDACCAVWLCIAHLRPACRERGCGDRHSLAKWAFRFSHRLRHDVWHVHAAHTGFRRRSAGWFKLLP